MLDNLYRELILDHYRRPRGSEPIPAPDRQADGQNPLCGDECSVAVRLDGDRLAKVGVKARGCSISVASASMMAQETEGRTRAEAEALEAAVRGLLQGKGRAAGVDLGDLEALEGVAQFPVRVKCALLPWATLREALHRPSGRGAATTEDTTRGTQPVTGGGTR